MEPQQPLGYAGPPEADPQEFLRASVVAELRALRRDVAESAAAQRAMWQQVSAGFEAADPSLLALRVDLADALEAVRDRVVATVSNTGDTTRAALADTTTGVEKATDRLRESLLDRLEEQHSVVRARLAEVAAQSLASSAATRSTQERLATLTTTCEQVRRTVSALQGDWNARVDEAAARAGLVAEDASAELRERVEGAVAALLRAAAAMADAHRRLDETTALLQLQAAGVAGPPAPSWADDQDEPSPPALVEQQPSYWDEDEEDEPEVAPEGEGNPGAKVEPEPEAEAELEAAFDPEPEAAPALEREDLDPVEPEPSPATWQPDPADPDADEAPDMFEPPPTGQPLSARRPVPRWRRY